MRKNLTYAQVTKAVFIRSFWLPSSRPGGALCRVTVNIQYGKRAITLPPPARDLPKSGCSQLPHPSTQGTSSDSTRPIWAPGAHGAGARPHPSLPGLRSCRGRHRLRGSHPGVNWKFPRHRGPFLRAQARPSPSRRAEEAPLT